MLQTKIRLKNGSTRTIAPIGNWSGHYFSDELYNSEKLGYKFKVKRGYLFEKGQVFKCYVDYLYGLKKNSDKGLRETMCLDCLILFFSLLNFKFYFYNSTLTSPNTRVKPKRLAVLANSRGSANASPWVNLRKVKFHNLNYITLISKVLEV